MREFHSIQVWRALYIPPSGREMCGMLFAKYEEKVRCLPLVPLCANSQPAGMSPALLLAVRPFEQDQNQEDASENANHRKNHKAHTPPASPLHAIPLHPTPPPLRPTNNLPRYPPPSP